MRVLSFMPAFLFAAASFVAAAPTALPTATVPSCASGAVPSGGSDATLQPIISIIANATSQIQPFCDQLSSIKQASGTPDVDAVSSIVVQINAVVSTCVAQLQASAQVDLTNVDLTNLCATIYALLTLVLTVLNTLVAIVLALAGSAVGTLQVTICNLLNATLSLVGCLKVFVTASLAGVLGPVITTVGGCVDLLLTIVVGLNLLVKVN